MCRIDKVTDAVWRVAVMFETLLPMRLAEVSTLTAMCGSDAWALSLRRQHCRQASDGGISV